MLHGNVSALHLPLIVVGRNSIDGGLVTLRRWVVQCRDEAVGHGGMVVHQLGQCVETAVR